MQIGWIKKQINRFRWSLNNQKAGSLYKYFEDEIMEMCDSQATRSKKFLQDKPHHHSYCRCRDDDNPMVGRTDKGIDNNTDKNP